jgi:protein-tyrosine phosphatase
LRLGHSLEGAAPNQHTFAVIATSGPSGTYPQRAYRNPLDSLVKFLDSKHGDDWAIWEFRAEGTGYPDSEVYDRVYHYPFPDHHPPPFALIPNIMASMRNWLHEKEGRVVVVHCKAGKGRSGTASCSYLISEEGWSVHKALQRFTERRMRPNMGKGVSIPSQLRWIGYVDRWKHNKIYVERQVEVLEVHCWGLRDGVKIQVEGFVDDGKIIKRFHTFAREEREVVRGEVKTTTMTQAVQEVMYKNGLGRSGSKKSVKPHELKETEGEAFERATDSVPVEDKDADATKVKVKDGALDGTAESKESKIDRRHEEMGTGDVVFRPARRVVLPTNDINIDVERRNKAAFDLTMVTAVAHVWFNAYFEGNGPEQNGVADESGVFEITWGAMDGIKGSSRKGTQAFEKIAVVWKALKAEEGQPGIVITEPKQGEPVKQSSPAPWKGAQTVTPSDDKDLGLRTASPTDSTANVSKASSEENFNTKPSPTPFVTVPGGDGGDNHLQHVKPHGPAGEEVIEHQHSSSGSSEAAGAGGGTSSGPTTAADPMLPSNTGDEAALRVVDSESHRSGVVSGVQHVSTDDLPDGRPEHSLKTAKEHALGSIGHKKKP